MNIRICAASQIIMGEKLSTGFCMLDTQEGEAVELGGGKTVLKGLLQICQQN